MQLPTACLLRTADNYTRPLALATACSNISLSTQAALIEEATAAEVASLLDFGVLVLRWYMTWMAVDMCVRLGMWLGLPQLGPSSSTVHIEVRQTLVSVVHSLFSIGATIFLALKVDRPFGVDAALRHIPHQHVTQVGCAFFSYLLWDLVHIHWHRGVHKRNLVEASVHHSCFLIMMLVNQGVLWFNYAFPVLYIGELSTVFLDARLLYRKFDMEEVWASAAFALTFAVTRIVLMGVLVVHLLSSYHEAFSLLGPMHRVSYLGGVPAMYCLNWFWFTKIVAAALKVKKPKAQ
jgi:hypothetical protein